jgi:carboxypeptidase T
MIKRLKLFAFVTLLMFMAVHSHAQDNVSPTYKKARIHYTSKNDIIKLQNNNIGIDHGIQSSKKYVESVFSTNEIAQAKKLGYTVTILIEDMEQHIQERNRTSQKVNFKNPTPCDDVTIDYTTPTNFNLGTMGGYLTYTEVLQELDDMRSAYPNLITAKSAISTFTTENGNTLQWVKISDNPDTDEAEPEVLYNSLHHAREPASMQQLIFYMWYLLENYATNTEVKAIVDATELYFIPVVNPDGYLHNESTNSNGGGFWRKNRRNNGNGTFGVDNNRNYNYHINGNAANSSWGGAGSSSTTSSQIYHGTSAFSEIENQAIKWFVEQHDFKIALNNHAFGELIYFPFGYADVATPDEDVYYAITTAFASQNEYNPIRGNPFSGDSDDYMYGTVGTHNKIFAMTPEIGKSFWPAQSEIIPICKGMMYTNLMAAHTANNYALLFDTQEEYLTSITGSISYNLQRLGLSGSTNFTVSVLPISANITSVGNQNQHTGLNLLEERSGTISYQLEPTISIGETIEYKLVIDNGIYTTEKMVSKVMGPVSVAINDTANDLNNWTSSIWNTTATEFVSPSSAITDSPSGNYSNNQNTTIEITNEIDLTTAGIASVEFYAKWDIEAGFDYVQFEVSSNDGATWQSQCGQYTQAGNALQGINGQPMYDGVQNEWVLEQVDLSDYLGETIKVRFQLISDSGTPRDGFYFDDFKISTIDQSALSTSSFDKIEAKIYPNPVTKNITIVLPTADDTSIKVYAINGQLVKQMNTSLLSTTIDLKNLSLGVYILKIQTSSGIGTYKILKE